MEANVQYVRQKNDLSANTPVTTYTQLIGGGIYLFSLWYIKISRLFLLPIFLPEDTQEMQIETQAVLI